MENEAMRNRHHAPLHPLEMLSDTQAPEEWGPKPYEDRQWTQPPTELWRHTLSQVEVYLN